jgi:hypothetical protein
MAIMSKKTNPPSGNNRKRRKRPLGRASVALATVMTAGMVLAPAGANAALTTGPEKAPYESVRTEGTQTALRDVLRERPKSEMAMSAFVQLAALCGSNDQDPDCTGITPAGTVPESENEQTGKKQIY